MKLLFESSKNTVTVSQVELNLMDSEVSIYRAKGNSDVYRWSDTLPDGTVVVGRYIRTDWRS